MTAHAAVYGRLGRDPEQRTSAAGKVWASASMAVQAGDDDAAMWFGVVAFGKVAETLCRHAKGDPIGVSGRLQMNRWTDREGKEHERLQIVADSIVSARTVRPSGGKRKAREDRSAPAPAGAGRQDDVPNDEIPF